MTTDPAPPRNRTAPSWPNSFRGALTAEIERELGTGLTGDLLLGLLAAPDQSIPVPPAENRAVWGPGGSADTAAARAIVARAETDRAQQWPQPLAHLAADYHRSGDRAAYEGRVFARQQRLSRAAMTAAWTLDDDWLDEVADGVQLMCEQTSWCWPAHDDAFTRHGWVLPGIEDPYVDLGAGEVAGQLAWLDQLLGSRLDVRYPGLRHRIRREVCARVLDPFIARRDWHWLGIDGQVNNWNPWIHGNVLVAALRLLDDPRDAPMRVSVVALALEGMDRWVTALPSDGAVDEGASYWWEGACRALEALDVLSYATRGRLQPVGGVASLREVVTFLPRMHLGGPWYLNVADGKARSIQEQPWHALYRAAKQVGDDAAEALAASHRGDELTEQPGLGRLLRGLTDPGWISVRPVRADSWMPRDAWLPSTQVMVSRPRAGSVRGLTLAVKGGTNGESHNHNDVGSFVIAVDGVPVVVDAGRPTYTAATFGPDRYDIWTMQSAWHNVPEIRGRGQKVGAEFAASGVAVRQDDATAEMSLEIAGAYGLPGLHSWRRSARLIRDVSRVVIADAWDDSSALDGGPTSRRPSTLHLLLAGEVSLADGAARIVPLDGARTVVVRWPGGLPSRVTVRECDDAILAESWWSRLTRLELDVTGCSEATITIDIDMNNESTLDTSADAVTRENLNDPENAR